MSSNVMEILKRARQIIYKFVWNEGRGMAWWRMALPRKEGVLGLRNPCFLGKFTTIKRAIKIWIVHSIWTRWMRIRYIPGSALSEIDHKQRQSLVWSAILRQRNNIVACAIYAPQYSLQWTMHDFSSMSNIYCFFRPSAPTDPFAIGIWSGQATKMSIFLWRIRWNKLHCFIHLHNWRMEVPDICLVCWNTDKMTTHLFINC